MPQRWKSREPHRCTLPWKLLRSIVAGRPVRATTCGSASSMAISALRNSADSDGPAGSGGAAADGDGGGAISDGEGGVDAFITVTVFSHARTPASIGRLRPSSVYVSWRLARRVHLDAVVALPGAQVAAP